MNSQDLDKFIERITATETPVAPKPPPVRTLIDRISTGIELAEELEKGNSLTSMRDEYAWSLVARVLRDLRDGKEVEW